jgi:Trk K+ transport system NAD-binding subunit
MYIAIAGTVGSYIAQRLIEENTDIMPIERDFERVKYCFQSLRYLQIIAAAAAAAILEIFKRGRISNP